MYLLPLLVALIYCSLCHCQGITEPNCERPLFNLSELQQNPSFTSLASGFIGSTKLVNFDLTCLAQGSTQGLYRAASVIVDVEKNPGEIVRKRFQLMCYDDEWRQPHIDSFETVRNLNLDPPIRYDCGSCHVHADNDYHCVGKYHVYLDRISMHMEMVKGSTSTVYILNENSCILHVHVFSVYTTVY